MFQGMDLARIIQVYVLQLGVGGIFYILMALLILRRDRKRLNWIFSAFFLSVSIGTIINVIYAPLTIEPIVLVLHFMTYYLFCFAMVFLLIFDLILIKSEKIINSKRQLMIITIFAILLAGQFFIGVLGGGITINESTDWKPVWSLPFFLYSVIVCFIFAIVPTINYALQIYKKFDDNTLRKKWKFFLIGIIWYYIFWFGTSLSNLLDIPLFRTLWALVGITVFISAYFIYYGVGRQIQ